MAWFWVFMGGGLGSLCRYGIGRSMQSYAFDFPFATIFANILSCIILGYLTTIAMKLDVSSSIKLFLMVGFCGGFSTFSTFSNETFQLIQSGNINYAAINIFGNLILCLGAIYIGILLGDL